MKARIAILIFCISIIGVLAYKFLGVSSVITNQATLPTPTLIARQTNDTLTYQDIAYDYEFFTSDHPDRLTLIANFETPIRGSTLAAKNKCDYAINGGFYATAGTPLGAFVGNGYNQPKALNSALFNGFFEFSASKAVITTTVDTNYTFILQSGPLLVYNASPLPLAIQNDEHARRSVVVMTNDGQILFVTFYINDSIYNGPLLDDLPMILKQFAVDQRISITEALNLDGGSATYFKNSDIELPELTPIGSMFCLQNDH
ncbi:MAG: phosphodiester glycosidase family protein [Microgenomates group bacterium]